MSVLDEVHVRHTVIAADSKQRRFFHGGTAPRHEKASVTLHPFPHAVVVFRGELPVPGGAARGAANFFGRGCRLSAVSRPRGLLAVVHPSVGKDGPGSQGALLVLIEQRVLAPNLRHGLEISQGQRLLFEFVDFFRKGGLEIIQCRFSVVLHEFLSCRDVDDMRNLRQAQIVGDAKLIFRPEWGRVILCVNKTGDCLAQISEKLVAIRHKLLGCQGRPRPADRHGMPLLKTRQAVIQCRLILHAGRVGGKHQCALGIPESRLPGKLLVVGVVCVRAGPVHERRHGQGVAVSAAVYVGFQPQFLPVQHGHLVRVEHGKVIHAREVVGAIQVPCRVQTALEWARRRRLRIVCKQGHKIRLDIFFVLQHVIHALQKVVAALAMIFVGVPHAGVEGKQLLENGHDGLLVRFFVLNDGNVTAQRKHLLHPGHVHESLTGWTALPQQHVRQDRRVLVQDTQGIVVGLHVAKGPAQVCAHV